MPAFVKTKEDERLWAKAKGIAEEAGHKEDWAYVTGIFKRMKGGKVGGLRPLRYKTARHQGSGTFRIEGGVFKVAAAGPKEMAGAFISMVKGVRAVLAPSSRPRVSGPRLAFPRGALPEDLDGKLVSAFAEMPLPQYGRKAKLIFRLNGPLHGWAAAHFQDVWPEELAHYLVVTPTGFDDTATWKRFAAPLRRLGVDARANIRRTPEEIVKTAKKVEEALTGLGGKAASCLALGPRPARQTCRQ